MKKNKTQILIDHYLDGSATPEEEKLLASELLRGDIPDEWKVVRMMLGELAMGEAAYDAEVEQEESHKKTFAMPAPVWWSVAASIALLIMFVGINHVRHTEKEIIAEVNTENMVEPTILSNTGNSIVNSRTGHIQTGETTYEAKTVLPHESSGGNQLERGVEEKSCLPDTTPAQNQIATKPANSQVEYGNLHYASMVVDDKSQEYQAPSRMEEYIAKLANYYHVKSDTLDCATAVEDSMVVCIAYVFNDNSEIDLFRRLLQVACWYEDTTPGYLLNYSHQQFFFCLKDMRKGLKYLWIAERIRDKILLYGTHSHLDTEVPSDCFREYRDKLSNTSTF